VLSRNFLKHGDCYGEHRRTIASLGNSFTRDASAHRNGQRVWKTLRGGVEARPESKSFLRNGRVSLLLRLRLEISARQLKGDLKALSAPCRDN
jgi:hypothetical protein